MASWTLRIQDMLNVRMRRRGLEELRGLLGPAKGLRLLDLGGGTGAVAEALGGPWAEVVVVEPSEAKVAHGREVRPSLRFEVGMAEALPLKDASFDRAMMLVAFHHVGDQPKALGELRRVLAPGGVLVLHEVDAASRTGLWMHRCEERMHPGSTRFHTPAGVVAMLDEAGFVEVQVHPARRGFHVRARNPPAPGPRAG